MIKLKNYKQMVVGKVYHFDNMELKLEKDGTLLTHYPEYEEMWYPMYEDDKWFKSWRNENLIEGEYKKPVNIECKNFNKWSVLCQQCACLDKPRMCLEKLTDNVNK